MSNHRAQKEHIKDKEQICFLNYDLKNDFEKFDDKKNNPLQFPNQLYVEVEKIIPLSELNFDNNSDNYTLINLQQTVSKEQYIQSINAIKKHIQAGDIYEINYCITFEAFDVAISPVEIYKKLNTISAASYSALAKLNHQYIICSSPELYLSKRGSRLITKPIKGTAKRGKVKEDDVIIRQELQSNLKERTENVMIVDVARNDLSRVAARGSVSVNKLYDIESYQQVHQMVSTVACEIKEKIVFSDIIQATFPMASMTGAPKIRAMQLIDEFELYNRGPYSGALGYIHKNNDFDLNVLIRSIFYDEEKQYLSFTVGSAITSLCNAEDEYDECLLKAKAMITVLNN
ncbi:MAG: anthranilate synthase component I family protein [Bacteroidia bacterium]|nr:anthranilate synthase component I family protein [Bacteroidia bacterium]